MQNVTSEKLTPEITTPQYLCTDKSSAVRPCGGLAEGQNHKRSEAPVR